MFLVQCGILTYKIVKMFSMYEKNVELFFLLYDNWKISGVYEKRYASFVYENFDFFFIFSVYQTTIQLYVILCWQLV